MISIEFDTGLDFPPGPLTAAAEATLNLAGASDADLTIVLAGDDRLQALNREYLGIDAPTDVLSFPAHEPDPETGRQYLGDVIISHARASEQAGTRGHSPQAEIQLLVIHGVLHLLGHDHADQEEKERMWALQDSILESLGLSGIRTGA